MYHEIHERVSKAFKFDEWENNYIKTKSLRQNTWDSVVETCTKMRDNEYPEDSKLPNAQDFTGELYKENLIHKYARYNVSMMTGSLVTYDLQSITSFRDENTELLESELNMSSAIIDIFKQTTETLYDWFYTGMGYIRVWWDKLSITVANETGEPRVSYVSSLKMYLDPSCVEADKSDIRYLFHVERYHWQNLATRFPKWEKEFECNKDPKDTVEIVTIQFKVDEIIPSVTITDNGQHPSKKWIIPVSDYQKFLNEGNECLEDVDVSCPYEVRKTFWYEATICPAIKEIIAYPKFVGEHCSYVILTGDKYSKSIYNRGQAWALIPLQKKHIVLMTTLVLMNYKFLNPDKWIASDALVDERDYLDNNNQLNYVAKVDTDWLTRNHGRDPINYVQRGEFAQMSMAIHNLLNSTLEDMSGVTKTMTGQPEYSNMSGVAVSQHQSMGQVFFKESRIKYQQFLTELGRRLMFLICRHRDQAHFVRYFGIDNQEQMVLVNDPENSPFTFEPERVMIFCKMVENLDLQQQIDRDIALQLYQLGLMSGVNVLEKMGITNPQRVYDSAKSEQGVLELIQVLQANPEVLQRVQQMLMQGVA